MVHIGGLFSLFSLLFMFIWYKWKPELVSMVLVRVRHSDEKIE